MVMIGGGAATGNDDNDSDSNSANVGLAVIRQSVAFSLKANVKKRHHAHACYSITIRGKNTAPASSPQSVHSHSTSLSWCDSLIVRLYDGMIV